MMLNNKFRIISNLLLMIFLFNSCSNDHCRYFVDNEMNKHSKSNATIKCLDKKHGFLYFDDDSLSFLTFKNDTSFFVDSTSYLINKSVFPSNYNQVKVDYNIDSLNVNDSKIIHTVNWKGLKSKTMSDYNGVRKWRLYHVNWEYVGDDTYRLITSGFKPQSMVQDVSFSQKKITKILEFDFYVNVSDISCDSVFSHPYVKSEISHKYVKINYFNNTLNYTLVYENDSIYVESNNDIDKLCLKTLHYRGENINSYEFGGSCDNIIFTLCAD